MSQCTATSSINFNFQEGYHLSYKLFGKESEYFLTKLCDVWFIFTTAGLAHNYKQLSLLRLNPRTSHLMSQKHKVECYLLKLLQDW